MNESDYIQDVYLTLEHQVVSRSTIVCMVQDYKCSRLPNIREISIRYGVDKQTASEIIIKVLSLKKIEHPVTIVLKSKV